MNTDRRLVLIEAKRQLYSFYARGRLVAQYRSDQLLSAAHVEYLRTEHAIPPKEAA